MPTTPVPTSHVTTRDEWERQQAQNNIEYQDRVNPNSRDAWERRQANNEPAPAPRGRLEDDIIAEMYPPVPPYRMDLGPSDEALFNESLQFILTEGLGQTGDPLKAFIRLEDLTDPELIKFLNSQVVSVTRPDPAMQDKGVPTDNPPDSPRNLELLSAADANRLGLFGNTLTWDVPDNEIDDIAATEIWVAESQNRSDAVFTGLVTHPGNIYTHASLDPAKAYYYWIRCVNWAGQYSVWEPSSDQGGYVVEGKATTIETIDKLMNALLGEDPAAYNAGTTYEAGDLCSYTVGDNTRRYKCILQSTGNLPTNTTYWKRIGILVEGDIDGVATIGIDGNLVVDGSVTALSIAANTITASQIKGDGFGILDLTSGKIQINTTDALEIKSGGNVIIKNGGDIKFEASDTDPALLNWNDKMFLGSKVTNAHLYLWPSVAGEYYFDMGFNPLTDLNAYFHHINMRTKYGLYVIAEYSTSYVSTMSQSANSTSADIDWSVRADVTATEQTIRYEGGPVGFFFFYPTVDKKVHLGKSTRAWDNCYADDFQNVADFYHLDDHDDLAALHAIQGSGKYNPLTGLEIIEDDTVPEWMLSKHKYSRDAYTTKEGEFIPKTTQGDLMHTYDGKPYLSLKLVTSLCMGAIRQLDGKIEELRKQI